MDKQLYQDLKMFPGTIGEIAARHGCQYQNVRLVIKNGRWADDGMVAIARQVLQERRNAMKALLEAA